MYHERLKNMEYKQCVLCGSGAIALYQASIERHITECLIRDHRLVSNCNLLTQMTVESLENAGWLFTLHINNGTHDAVKAGYLNMTHIGPEYVVDLFHAPQLWRDIKSKIILNRFAFFSSFINFMCTQFIPQLKDRYPQC